MKKRGQNEGNIYERSDGRWEARVSLGFDTTGKHIRKSVYGRTRAEVREKMDDALRKAARGQPLAESWKVGAYLLHWLDASARAKLRPSTFTTYRSYIVQHLVPGLGRIRLDKLTPLNVQTFVNAKIASGLSPRTVQQIHAILRKALNQAMKWGLIDRNVATLIDLPRVQRPEIEPLSPDEAREFLAAVRGDRLEALYTLALACGLRQGEALGLHWRDIDLERGTLMVRAQVQRVDGVLTLVEPKTQRSRRTLNLPTICTIALGRHKALQAQQRLLAGPDWQDWGLVFTTRRGTPLDGTNVTQYFQRILAKAGIRRQRFHDLRHACASFLLVQGVSPRVVMELLGHSQIGITMNLYTHVMPSLKHEAAERMDAVLAMTS